MKEQEKQKRATMILIAGTFFNLSIGVLYIWGELKKVFMMPEASGGWGWTSTEAGLPYTLAIVFFAIGVLAGGRIQDKIGPRWVVTAGGFLVGLGLILSAFVGNNPMGVALCYGVITGLGIGIGYSSVTPPALKWFHPSKKGLVSGFTIGGFGFAAIFYAPLVASMLNRFYLQAGHEFAIEKTFLYLGIAVMAISMTVAQFVKNPPVDHAPIVPKNFKQKMIKPSIDFTWKEMIKTRQFFLISFLFLFSATVGLMIIGNTSKIAQIQAGITNTALLLSLLALMNGIGRLFGGIISDKIGRTNTLFVVLILQMFNMIGFMFYSNLAGIIIGIIFAGLCFGTLLTVFPSMTADRFGLKNYGANYGIVYLFWGLAGIVAPVFADHIFDLRGSFNIAYIICATMMPVLILVNYLLKKEINRADKLNIGIDSSW